MFHFASGINSSALTCSSRSPRVLSLLIIVMTGLGVVSSACAHEPSPPVITFSVAPPDTSVPLPDNTNTANGQVNLTYLCNPDPNVKTGDFFKFLKGELESFQNNNAHASDLPALETQLGQLQTRVTLESDKYTKTPTIPAGSTTISLNDCYSDAEWKLFQSTFATVACDWLTHFNAPHLCSPELQQAANTPVQDTTPPVITLNGPLEVVVEIGTVYTDTGATALDNLDGDITNKIEESYPPIDTKTLTASRTYRFTYNVSDSAGNAATPVTRIVRVRVQDMTPPVITLKGCTYNICYDGPEGPSTIIYRYPSGMFTSIPFATASDNVDGDITSKISQSDVSHIRREFSLIDREYILGLRHNPNRGLATMTGEHHIPTLLYLAEMFYTVSDSAGNVASVTRWVKYIDADLIPPVITLKGNSHVFYPANKVKYMDPGATASDNIDGDITRKIKMTGLPADLSVPGLYTVFYEVSDSSFNTTVARRLVEVTKNVPDLTPPVITLNGPSEIVIEMGATYTDAGATATDNIDGDISSRIKEKHPPIDTSTLTASRTYQLTYNVSDSAGNAATPVTRIVRLAYRDRVRQTFNLPVDAHVIATFIHPETGVATTDGRYVAPGAPVYIVTITAMDGAGAFYHVNVDNVRGAMVSVGDTISPNVGKVEFQTGSYSSIGTTSLTYSVSDGQTTFTNNVFYFNVTQ